LIEPGKAELVKELAYEAGFADVRMCAHESGSLFFLFLPYRPAKPAGYGKVNLSNYYITSQKGYLFMKNLLLRLAQEGVYAEEFQGTGVKQLALKTGGFIGLNSLYYHEQYGSFVSIHVVKTNIVCGDSGAPGQSECPKCGNCIAACPAGAITGRGLCVSRCVRAHSNERRIPAGYRGFIYQLLGCERCQAACPFNRAAPGEAYSFDLVELLEGKHLKQIRTLVGPNYGRRRIIVGQAVIYAANAHYAPALAAVEALAGDEFVGETARWAREILKKS